MSELNRRRFLSKAGALAASISGLPLLPEQAWAAFQQHQTHYAPYTPEEIARNEDFWYPIQKAYTVNPHFINLENGYFSLQADEVMQAQLRHIQMINESPAYYMRTKQADDRVMLKKRLAAFAGVSHEEIAILRNTTEALNIVIMGLDMQKGDEFVYSSQDYGSMIEAFQLRARRFGTVNRIIDLPLHPKSDQEIVDRFEAAITPRTKALHVTHLINLTGQVLPVRAIAEMAHAKGVEVISDSAHAFAHLSFKIPDLGCDYLGTSLHKWLGTPVGLGMLYVKKEKIKKVWPLLGDTGFPDDDIRKFEHIGTHSCAADLTIANAIRFHEMIGAERKEARLRYLTQYWMEKSAKIPKIRLNTPQQSMRYCGLGNVGVENMTPSQLAQFLFEKHRVYTVAIDGPVVKGVRVTPHLYTTLSDLDALVEGLTAASQA